VMAQWFESRYTVAQKRRTFVVTHTWRNTFESPFHYHRHHYWAQISLMFCQIGIFSMAHLPQ
jgi:hypothetical protein